MLLKRIFILALLMCNYRTVLGEENLALNKSYEFNCKPNYKLCTDELDKIQLTDGKTYGSSWRSKNTVGWQSVSTGIEVIIDLRQSMPIDKVKVYSIGGGFADVEFPQFIAVLVSDDDRTYSFAGLVGSKNLVNLRSVGHNGVPHTFVIDNLNTQGRFVKVVVRPRRYYFFLDEIEVIGGASKLNRPVDLRKDTLTFSDSKDLLGAIEDYLQLKTNIDETIKTLQNNQKKFSADFTKTVLSELEFLTKKCKSPTDKIYSPKELSALGRKLGEVRAQIYKQVYKSEFVCYAANPMEILFEKDMPFVDAAHLQQLDVQLWQREYESAAVNIINCSQKPLDLLVSVSPLTSQDGKKIDSSKTITARRAIFVKALRVGLVADPLVLQPEQAFQLQPGSITQIWLTIFNPELAAGNYNGTLAVSALSGRGKSVIETMEINLHVANLTFPKGISLNTCVWDEYTWFDSIADATQLAMAKDMQSHYVNVSVVHPLLIQSVSQNNRYLLKFDKELRVKDFARMHLLYFEWQSGRKDRGRFGQWMSPLWKSKFSAWIKGLVASLKRKGIGYDRFALYPFDESLCDEFYEVARLIKQVDPNILIFTNSFGKGPRDFMRFKDLVDIWCMQRMLCTKHPEWLATIKSFGKEVWTYGGYGSTGPPKNHLPSAYYRVIAWDAFNRGQTGIGCWVYIDFQEHAWNDTLKPGGYYALIYDAVKSPVDTYGEKIIPSRRWEAWREGVEDYEYLVQLHKAIEQTKTYNPQAAADAQATLNLQVKRVVNNRADCEIIYSARRIIAETLLQLKQLEQSR